MRVLILSHTRERSFFKIGSHHYANKLSQSYEVYFSGIPYTIMHRLLKKKDVGAKQLCETVKLERFNFLVPIKIKYIKSIIRLNSFFDKVFRFISRNTRPYYNLIICDTPYFAPYLDLISYDFLIYRPTDNYEAMDGNKVLDYESEIIQHANAIVATSNPVLKNIKETYGEHLVNKVTTVIANGFDDNIFYNKNNSRREGAVYIGAIDTRFDFDALEVLAKSFEQVKFDIYGPISDTFIERTKELMATYHNINFGGGVNYGDTPEIMNKAQIGLLLLVDSKSNQGRSPMKLWEYYSCGLKTLYSRIQIDEDIEGFFRYDDYIQMIDAFDTILSSDKALPMNDSILRHSWSNKCTELVELYFSHNR